MTASLQQRAAMLALFAGGCIFVGDNKVVITYEVAQQEFKTPDFGTTMGNVPTIDCSTGGDAVCTRITPPAGMSSTCDATTRTCALHGDVRLVQTVNLATQKDFPSSVASSSAIQAVQVNNVFYWTPSNSLSFTTPPIDLYVGGQTVQLETDAGATLLGTFPPLPAGTLTNCRATGTPGSQGTDCTLPLTDAGRSALGTLAKEYKTPFNVLVVAHLTFHAGDVMPAGQLDMVVQPELGFVIPLK